ncbi:sugar phosphate isomerase/epimerase family protein [Acuticoccus sp. MNP-M23]|uniref:sugar phosphate isomerase/epimerase family protein n=1 Tax=Acuticoccus sp. MNP-M23 TaxID=3072793 RepID=UPI002814B721|nr:sugar phosphate isomerase/epimerase family protein [Acuticoccus sp. MNP-M23]WMS41234.1 sugar phosphate isomerase/epimerase family protein [Acuticoccus sp. MNP-M23]
MLRFAYNTIGCSNHALPDALEMISEAGYQGVIVTLDVHHMNPLSEDFEATAEALKKSLAVNDLAVSFDTGGRFLLDPRDRMEPTLLTPSAESRARRLDLLKRAIRICEICEGEAVIFTTGRPKRGVDQADAANWLLDGLAQLCDAAGEKNVTLALEPEPGHMVGKLDDFKVVRDTVKQMTEAPPLRLALDVGHVVASGDRAPHQAVKEFSAVLGGVAVSGMRDGVHAHLPLGEGEVSIPDVLSRLRDVDYGGLIAVKLPQESYRADTLIPSSIDWLLENVPSD